MTTRFLKYLRTPYFHVVFGLILKRREFCPISLHPTTNNTKSSRVKWTSPAKGQHSLSSCLCSTFLFFLFLDAVRSYLDASEQGFIPFRNQPNPGCHHRNRQEPRPGGSFLYGMIFCRREEPRMGPRWKSGNMQKWKSGKAGGWIQSVPWESSCERELSV